MKMFERTKREEVSILVILSPRKNSKLHGHSKGFTVKGTTVEELYKVFTDAIKKEG